MLGSRWGVIFLFVCFWAAGTAWAHPHVYSNVSLEVVFDSSGLSGVRNRWSFDEEYSASVLASVDKNRNGKIDPSEVKQVEKIILQPLQSHNYLNYVLAGADFLVASGIRQVKATMVERRLDLDFTVGFRQAAVADYTMLVVVVADLVNNIQMTSDMENAVASAPSKIEVEYFADGLDGLTLFRGFSNEIRGLFLRFRLK